MEHITVKVYQQAAILLTTLLCCCTAAMAAPILSVDSGSAQPGTDHTLHISISDGSAPYAGMNGNIILPQCMIGSTVNKGALVADNGFVLDSHMSSTQDFNSASVLVYSSSLQFTGSGQLLNISLAVGDDCTFGRYEIKFAESEGQALANMDGSISVATDRLDSYLMVSTVDPANDSDIDGMDDTWEEGYFTDLSHDGTADADQDGYSDFWEYINSSQGLMDLGYPYDPAVANSPGGPGYEASGIQQNIWILLMPAILSSVPE